MDRNTRVPNSLLKTLWLPLLRSYAASGPPQQDVQAWGVAVPTALTLLYQPTGFAQYLVCSERLRHEQYTCGWQGERGRQGIHFLDIVWLVNNEFEVCLAGVAQETQDGEVDTTLISDPGIGELGRD